MILLEMIPLAILFWVFLCRSDIFWERACLFGNALRIREYVFASGCVFVECTIVLGPCSLLGSRRGRLRRSRASAEELNAWRKEGVCFFCWPRSAHGGRGNSHGVLWWLMDGYDIFVT